MVVHGEKAHSRYFAETTLKNLDDYFAGAPLENEICYRCLGTGGAKGGNCPRRANGRCH